MLHKIDLLPNHSSFNLNRHIYYFLLKIRNVSSVATFNPYTQFLQPDFLKRVRRSPGLKSKLEAFFDKFKALGQPQRDRLISKFKEAQNIPAILENLLFDGDNIKLNTIDASIQTETYDLFIFLYKSTLMSYGKNEHYELLYDQIKNKICPFCGLEKLNHPDLYNQDYDHILYKGDYPLSSVNMRNLIPMGTDCNQIYKKTKDVLYSDAHLRRKFLNPYNSSIDISFSLNGSVLPKGGSDKGIWTVSIVPDNDYTQTWDSVFCITDRCKKNELEAFFDIWMGVFKSYLKRKSKGWNEILIKNEMEHTGFAYLDNPFDTSNIIKGSLFIYLSKVDNKEFFNAIIKEVNS